MAKAYLRKRWTYEECKAELRYIQSVNPKEPGGSYNDDPACFARYCNMQANHAFASGFPLMSHDMAQARDVANPTFRSDMRVEGWTVDGWLCHEDADTLALIKRTGEEP